MKRIFPLLMLLVLFSCSDSNNDLENQYNLDVNAEFSVFNEQNEDLLDSNTSSHLNHDNIQVIYRINGENQEIYNTDMGNPENFKIYKHVNEYRVRVSLNYTDTEDRPVTYIQWSENDTDTIEVSYKRLQNSILKTDIWLNGEHIWELGTNTVDPYFKLIK